MVTQKPTSTNVPPEPTYPQDRRPQQRDTELAVTPAAPGATCDSWPAVAGEAAITATPTTHTVTRPCNAMDRAALVPCIQEALRMPDHVPTAGSLCPDCQQDTVCSTCQQCHYCNDIDLPCAAALRRRIAQALAAIDQRRPRDRDGDDGSASSVALLPSFQGPPATGGAAVAVGMQQAEAPNIPGRSATIRFEFLTGGMYVLEKDEEDPEDWQLSGPLMSEEQTSDASLPLDGDEVVVLVARPTPQLQEVLACQ